MRVAQRPRLYPKLARTRLKLCLAGDRGVGKTALLSRYVLNEFSDRYFQTVGTRVYRKRVGVRLSDLSLNVIADLEIWDITGDKGLSSILREAYFHGAHGVVAVCDVSRRETLYDLDYWLDSALQVVKGIQMEIAVNKWDMTRRRVKPRDVDLVARAYESPYILVSARSGENVDALFSDLIIRIVRRKLTRRAYMPLPTIG